MKIDWISVAFWLLLLSMIGAVMFSAGLAIQQEEETSIPVEDAHGR